MKISKQDLFAIGVLIYSVLLFFLPLFYPTLKLYVTPGYSNSDILHFNYPLKEILSQSLKRHELPVWTDAIGTGFPLIAESQIQAFSLLNILLFSLFPTPVAFNLGYVICFILFSLGMYLAARNEGYSPFISFFCSFLFTFSGANIVRIQHYNILLGFWYIPFIYICAKRFIQNPRSRAWLALPFLLSQFILSSHLPSVFTAGVFFLILYSTWRVLNKKQKLTTPQVKKLFLVFLLTLGLSSIQLFPTAEYFNQSTRGNIVKLFGTPTRGLSIENLIQYVRPYAYGDIRQGTYTLTSGSQNFWEVFNYIGVIPLILALLSLFYIRKYRRVKLYWIVIGILAVLALESNSPLHFIYAFPPFSWFRVYTRFLSFAFFLIILLAGYILEKLPSLLKTNQRVKHLIIGLVVCLSILDVWTFAYSYNPTIDANHVLEPPKTATYLSGVYPNRIYSLNAESLWYPTFISYGWKDTGRYTYLGNSLSANSNLLYNIPQINLYAGLVLGKQLTIEALIKNNLDVDPAQNTASFSATGTTMLTLLSTNYIITPYTLTNPELDPVYEVKSPYADLRNIRIYRLKSAKPQYYLAHRIDDLRGVREVEQNLRNPAWITSFDAIVDSGKILPQTNSTKDSITAQTYTDTKKSFSYTADADAYFLLSTYFYPGWEARLDGEKIPIYNGNISSMAVFAPKGNHALEFTFVPRSLHIGTTISGIAILLYAGIIIGSVYRRRV